MLELLGRHQIDYIVVGMTAGVLQGAPAVTFDLDIVYARTSDNVGRLLQALSEIDAYFRTDPDRRIVPNESHLVTSGHKLLMTSLGQLDVLGSLDEGQGYEELLPDTVVVRVKDLEVRVLGLARLITEKTRANRDKDRAVIPLLKSTLERLQKRDS